jgi:hypothetical protein
MHSGIGGGKRDGRRVMRNLHSGIGGGKRDGRRVVRQELVYILYNDTGYLP